MQKQALVNITRPLVSADFACTLLNCSYDRLLAKIEEGEILWAFDVRIHRKGKREREQRHCIRVFWPALVDYISKQKSVPDNFETVVAEILGAPRGMVAKVWLERRLSLSSQHVGDLIGAKQLQVARRGERGPGRGFQLDYASAKNFLRARRYPEGLSTSTKRLA